MHKVMHMYIARGWGIPVYEHFELKVQTQGSCCWGAVKELNLSYQSGDMWQSSIVSELW